MNKPIKLNKNDYNEIYFASDFHYNHQRDFIWTPRGFNTYQEHDKFLEDQCKSLTEKDLLIYLGDYSLNTTDEQTRYLLSITKATTFYIFGNHEGYHSRCYKNALHQYIKENTNCGISKNLNINYQIFPFSVYSNGVGFPGISNFTVNYFGEEAYFQIGNNFYFCRHMAPLIWDRMKYNNQFALCGHSHGNLVAAQHNSVSYGKLLDVGVDTAIKVNGSAFLTVAEVDNIMNKKKIVIHDHHGEDHV